MKNIIITGLLFGLYSFSVFAHGYRSAASFPPSSGSVSFPVLAQLRLHESDDLTDLKKISEKLSSKRFSFTANYTLFDHHSGGKILETQQMKVNIWDLMVNIRSKHFHVIKNKIHYLYVDYDHKLVMLNKVYAYKEEMKQFEKVTGLMNIDTILKYYKDIQVVNSSGSAKTYRFKGKPGMQYAYIDMEINKDTYSLIKVVVYYAKNMQDLIGKQQSYNSAQPPRMEVVFSNFVQKKKPEEKDFSIGEYVGIKGKDYFLNIAYSKYKFVNNTNVR